MKRIIKLLVLILVLVVSPKVFALDVTTVNASEDENGKITVTGTVPSEMVAVSISIFDETGNTFIKMLNTNVLDDNTFSLTFNMEPKTYVLKVADYIGGSFKEVKVSIPSTQTTIPDETPTNDTTVDDTTTTGENTPEEVTTTENNTNPSTGDKIYLYGIITIVALIGMIAVVKKIEL